MPTRAHDDPFTYAWALFGWVEDPDAGATLSCIVVTGDVILYAVWRDVELRFWWGSYIPYESWGSYAWWELFDLQELIDTREAPRTINGDAEFRKSATAERVTAPDFKSEIFNPTIGYAFLIYPASFGQVTVRDQAGRNITANWTPHRDISIDGVLYNVIRIRNPISVNANVEFRFHW
jgi:hypothetical protein